MATAIQFRFPECQRVDLHSLIPRATVHGLQLLDEFLQWDSDKRPSAQQALKYSFFQITKRGSDPIQLPTSLLAKHQQLHAHGHNQDVVSHISLNDIDKYAKDVVSFRQFDQYNSHNNRNGSHKQSQHQPPQQHPLVHSTSKHNSAIAAAAVVTVASAANASATILTDATSVGAERSPKRTKPENGIITSQLFNGDFNNYTTSLNNNYHQSEVSAVIETGVNDDAIQRKMYPNTTKNDTGFSSMKNNQNNQNEQQQQQRKDSITNTVISRRNSRLIVDPQNPFLNEKISDIYVNRNLGKLYDNTIRGSIYNNKLYNNDNDDDDEDDDDDDDDDRVNGGTRRPSQEFSFKNQTFLLQDKNTALFNHDKDSKVYNIFSKQQLAKPRQFNQQRPNNDDRSDDDFDDDGDDEDEDSYLNSKMKNTTIKQQQQPRKSISIIHDQRQEDIFEDKELDRLLG